jgi:excisionase family DNA binding protein
MTVTEAANALGVAEETIRKRIQRGAMQARRVGERVLLIPSDEVDRWREIGRVKPGPKPKEPTPAELHRDIAEHQDALEEARRRIRGEAPTDTDASDQPDELNEARRQLRGEI